jgi:uncharacterized protein with HEPN domain
MPRKLEVSLWDIKNTGEEILEYTSGKTLADYLQNRQLRRSVERCFTIIGEAMVRVRQDFPSAYARLVDSTKVVNFRNHLVHRYDVVDDEEVWKLVEASLPLLLAEVSRIIEADQL